MAEQPKRQEPEIMPPKPNVEPQRSPTEIPQDKHTPERNAPARGTLITAGRQGGGGNWWC
jgi:hypothetical protein